MVSNYYDSEHHYHTLTSHPKDAIVAVLLQAVSIRVLELLVDLRVVLPMLGLFRPGTCTEVDENINIDIT